MIVNGWLDWAIKMPSISGKVNGGVNPVRGIFMHSAEGYAGTLLNPTSQWGYNGGHTWHLSNLFVGPPVQHYPLTAQCWHATAANNNYIGVENEGDYPKEPSLNANQIANAQRFIAEIAAWKGWIPSRPQSPTDISHTLWEHNEVVRLGGTSSECPSGRIPWGSILTPEEDDDMGMKAHNAPAAWFENKIVYASAPGSYYIAQAQADFGLPDEARDILLGVKMTAGASTWYNGQSTYFAGAADPYKVFWVRMADPRPGQDAGKTINYRCETDCQFERVECLAYN